MHKQADVDQLVQRLLSQDQAAVTWRATAPVDELARALVTYRQAKARGVRLSGQRQKAHGK